MELFGRLFDSRWRERGDAQVRARYSQHFDSMAEQVMANRHEIAYLHAEINRLSQDLSGSLLLNRALIRHLLESGHAPPELEAAMQAILADHQPPQDPEGPISKFCENCGRPLADAGHKCSYCVEIEISLPPENEPAKPKKKKRKKV
ncbi:MAG: hypothetical protein WC314_15555 [Vulcanimicrobiota bacterium]